MPVGRAVFRKRHHLADASRFKRFPGMIACGEGELVKTFLRIGQVAAGEEVI